MEKRFILAIVLSFLVLLLWQTVFVKKQAPPQEAVSQPEVNQPVQKAANKKAPEPVPSKEPAAVPQEDIQPVSGQAEENIIVDTSLYRAVWSNKGAVLKSWQLKKYLDDDKENLELISRKANDAKVFPLFLNSDDSQFDSLVNSSLFDSSETRLSLKDGAKAKLRFVYADERGNKVEKIFAFQDGRYDFNIEIRAFKNNQKIDPRVVWGPSFGNLSPAEMKKRLGGSTGIAVFPPTKVARRDERKFNPEKGNAFNFVQWAAYENNYFAAIFILDPQKSSAVFLKQGTAESPLFYLSMDHIQTAYIGPKNHDTLDKWGHQTKKIIKFGLFGWISEILYKSILVVHKAFPNWGFSIIILTLIIKILFFPLTYSSTKSMSKMQELQPKIKALRGKYKKAKKDIGQRRKMNEEMMKLYKEEGINPAGGCLPLLIQIPIFWGFFRLLSVAVEFRQAPFMLWIKDLSVHDPLYITPILMGVTQYISQKMTPTSADPSQQKMMLIMPVIMTVFFLNFQSGLVLYWLTNNVLQIGQQYIMNRMMKKKKKDQHGKRRKK